jgi:HemK-related putative methylase
LAEALRVLQPEGTVAIVDSPVYHDASSGAQMVRERETQFQKKYGFASNSIPSENYLTYDRLEELARKLGLRWQRIEPFYGWRWALRPWRARLRGHREPARFMVILGSRDGVIGGVGARESGRKSSTLRVSIMRFLTRWCYRLFHRGRYDRLVLEDVAGRPILVLPGVFNPKLLRTGELLARTLDARLVPPGSTALDMGTGSGIGAVFAAQLAGKVVAVDVNPAAVRCARINVLLNRVEERVDVLEGDLFAPVGAQRFDVVLFNPPYYRGTPKDNLDKAWRSEGTVERFATELRDHLTPRGCALVILSSDGEQEAFLHAFRSSGQDIGVVTSRDLGSEVVTVYRLGIKDLECDT